MGFITNSSRVLLRPCLFLLSHGLILINPINLKRSIQVMTHDDDYYRTLLPSTVCPASALALALALALTSMLTDYLPYF